jgi:transaldolase / glucose-6-phosphate isomerase
LSETDEAVRARLAAFTRDDVVGRIQRKDYTVWSTNPTEVADRLGWLTVIDEMPARVEALRSFASAAAGDGLRTAILAGMGGSSLAPEVFRECFGVADGLLDLIVLDSTHPDQIADVEGRVDLDETLFVISSKSGSTIETDSHLRYFWERVPDGRRFAAVTDAGTPLEALARERGFREVFVNRADIGGRYSALSYFGLMPAALIGAPLDLLLDGAIEMASTWRRAHGAERWDLGLDLGVRVGEAARAGRDKLTIVLPKEIAAFGAWLEQLIAESTGKRGTGIVPVVDEPPGAPAVFGDDRLFAASGDAADVLGAVEEAGHPLVRLPNAGPEDLGREMYRWEFATAIIGSVLGINPFDQPDVQSAKDATARVLGDAGEQAPDGGDAAEILDAAAPPDYVAIQAYVPRDAGHVDRLERVRLRIRDRHRVAVTVGFGPRFLHSTGQLHKGGSNTVVAIQVVEPPSTDLAIPGRDFTFGRLLRAQADGDLTALRARGRRTARVDLAGLEALADSG